MAMPAAGSGTGKQFWKTALGCAIRNPRAAVSVYVERPLLHHAHSYRK
jgi:hypothetical protein